MKAIRGIEIVEGTCLRVRPEERKSDLHYYDIRHADEDGFTPCTIEKFVLVNHMGTIAAKKPLPLNEDGQLVLTEEEQHVINEVL